MDKVLLAVLLAFAILEGFIQRSEGMQINNKVVEKDNLNIFFILSSIRLKKS